MADSFEPMEPLARWLPHYPRSRPHIDSSYRGSRNMPDRHPRVTAQPEKLTAPEMKC